MANWYRYPRSCSRGIHRLTIYLMEAMNRLKTSVRSLASLSTGIAATQARFLQPSVDQSTGSVSTEVATSVASSRDYMMPKNGHKGRKSRPTPTEREKESSQLLNLPTKATSTLALRLSNTGRFITGGSRNVSKETPNPYNN
jgi:hypothetical protein